MPDTTGKCFCGAVTWSSRGAKTRNLICHCESCKRATSSPITAFLGFARQDVTWSGEINHYESSPGSWRGFCPKCGSRLYFKSDRWPDEVHIHAATLDDPDAYVPDQHVLWEERTPWLESADTLPKSDGFGQTPAASE